MNKKGFTLVELLAVIVILGIILAIGVPAYNKISANLKQKQYDNLVEDIKVAAKKYFADVEKKDVTVETLVKTGYIKGENNEDTIHNPKNNSDMKCSSVNRHTLKFSLYEDVVGDCPNDENVVTDIVFCKDESCNEKINIENKWLKREDIDKLELEKDEIYLSYNKENLDNVKRAVLTVEEDPNNSYILENDVFKIDLVDQDNTYYLTIEFENGIKRTYKRDIKIDTNLPDCRLDLTYMDDKDQKVTYTVGNWINKSVESTLYYSDNGSGIKNIILNEENVDLEKNSNHYDYNFTETGTYNLNYEIIDNAGNSATCNVDNIMIDVTPPTVECEVNNNGKTSGVGVTCTCTDSNSICTLATQTRTGLTTTTSISFTDNAGNSSSKTVNVSAQLQKRSCSTCNGCGCEKYNSCKTKDCGVDYTYYSGTLYCRSAYSGSSSISFDCETASGKSCKAMGLTPVSGSCTKHTVYNSCRDDDCGCDTRKRVCSNCNCETWGSWANATSCSSSNSVGCQTIYSGTIS